LRKFFSIPGMIVLILVAAAGAIVGMLVYHGRELDAQSLAFVDGAVPAITAHWDKEQLLHRLTPELRQSLKPGRLAALFAAFSRRGRLVEYEGAKG
jgi:hypothetical protein